MAVSQIKITSHPTAGGIPNLETGAQPGVLTKEDVWILRELVKRVADIAQHPGQEEKRKEWYRHNELGKGKPMLLVFPEDAWFEILPTESLQIKDVYWKQWEWYLKHLVYRYDKLKDDFVTEAELRVPMVFHDSGWGMEPVYKRTE